MPLIMFVIQDNRPFYPQQVPGIYDSYAAAEAHLEFFTPAGNGFNGGEPWSIRAVNVQTLDEVKGIIAECDRLGITKELLQSVPTSKTSS